MSNLFDGTVVSSEATSSGVSYLGDFTLRIGRVLNAYPPGNSKNINGRFTEYDVEMEILTTVSHSQLIFHNVLISSLFGSVTDYFRWTPRLKEQGIENQVNLGALVLVACLSGDPRQALIVGGWPHPACTIKDFDASFGHHMRFEFNGISCFIDKEGALILSRKGATKESGFPVIEDDEAAGAGLDFKANGSVVVKSAQDNQYLNFNHETKVTEILADKKMTVRVADGKIIIDSKGLFVGGESLEEAFVKGTSYRREEDKLFGAISQAMTTLSIAMNGAQAAIAASPAAAAAPFFTTMATACQQLQAACQQFQAASSAANKFLSEKNYTD